MTDKDIKDYCKNCSVEPPAMKFKCPECEHNPDKENFAKDINVPSKEQIMIDGVDVRNCKGIDLSLSPLVKCKSLKFKTSDGGIAGIWCSDHTNCYFKQLARKTQECEQKDKELKELKRQYKLSCLDCEYKNTKADVERYRKECDFWKHQAELGSETTDRLAKQLEEKEQECEELKKELNGSEKWRIKAESLNEKLSIEKYRYRKALDEVEEIAKFFNKNELCFYKEINECDCCDMGADCNYLRRAKILYIINTLKEESDG